MTKKQRRQLFRTEVFERDQHCCAKCNKSGVILDAHHITDRNDMPNGGYVKENGIALCHECHLKAEQFHQTGEAADGYSPEELYEIIGSSYESACRAAIAD